MQQIALPIAPPQTNQFTRTPEQEEALQKAIADVRVQAQEAERIARQMFPELEFEKLSELPTDKFSEVWAEYHRLHPRPVPLRLGDRQQQAEPKKFKPLIPWTLERKQKDRARRLLDRLKRKYGVDSSQPELFEEVSSVVLWIDEAQWSLVQNPGYFGVCSLPGYTESSPVVLPNLEQLAAIARENELRAKEAGLVPVHIPVALKTPEYEAIAPTERSDSLEQ